MPRHAKLGYAWLPPRPDQPPNYDVLVNWRWSVSLLAASIGGLALLFALPRRTVMRMLKASAVPSMAVALLVLLENLRGIMFPQLKQVDLPLEHLPPGLQGLQIAQISDLHLGKPFSLQAARRAVAAVKASDPDLIVFTGDFVSHHRYLPLLRPSLQPLQAPYGCYAVWGNHDHWESSEAIARQLRSLGVTVLVNAHRTIAIDGAVLVVAGVDDMWEGQPDLDAALVGVPAAAPVILLAHAPDFADTAAHAPVAVQLAGHTHAGHIRLPGLGPAFLPRYGVRYDRGLRRVGKMWLYVSHGLSGLPVRIGCRAEVTIHTLRRCGESEAAVV